MHLTVLAVPECPNAPLLEERLAAALEGRDGVSVSREVIFTDGEAARWGMTCSPGRDSRRACHAGFIVTTTDGHAVPHQ